MIKNIVFDFGGVIVDIDRDKAVQAFIKLGLADADTRLDKYHQTGIFQELEEGKLSADEFRKQLGDLCGRELTMEETKQAWLGFFNEVDLRKLDYILGLRKSYHVYLLSNTNPFCYVMGMQSGVFIRRETAERLLRQTIFILPVGTYQTGSRNIRLYDKRQSCHTFRNALR